MKFRNLEDFKFYKSTLAKLQDPANVPTTCTKYEFVNALKRLDPSYYDRLLLAYSDSAELQFFWNTVNELDRTNEDFRRFARYLEATEDQIYDIFRTVAIEKLEKPWET